jgi:formylglycine-generating enzyme required for sulfatase activity
MKNHLYRHIVSLDCPFPVKWWAWFLVFCLVLTAQTAAGQEKKITNDLGMTFIRVAPGTFFMGSPENEAHRTDNETRHRVHIQKAFYLQQTEVTLEQWRAVMGESWFINREGMPRTPVTRVSFYDAREFIRKLNRKGTARYRLPSEAEWEYACRAGTTTAYSWGNEIDCSRAMYANNPKKRCECCDYYRSVGLPNGPAPVGSFDPNPWGFHDMHGNVWEWCADVYTEDIRTSGGKSINLFTTFPRVRRGGSWFKYGWYLRSANRAYAHHGARFQTTGFRLVRETD